MYENKTLSFKIGYVNGRKMVELKTKSISEYPNLIIKEYHEGYDMGKQDAILKKIIG